MTPEEILSYPARVLSQAQREKYFNDGFVGVEEIIPAETLNQLQDVTADFVEQSKTVNESGSVFDIGPGHSADNPVLRRLKGPDVQHPDYWNYATGILADIAADLVGPNVVFHHSKLNFKWSGGGEEIKWHQDIQFWPHTDFSPLTIGVYLADVDDVMGPMGVFPSSHQGPLYDQYLDSGEWGGAMNPKDVAQLDMNEIVWLTGPAGSVTVHNCCMIHGSVPNNSPNPRPLLLQTYSAVQSYPIAHIGANGVTGPLSGTVIGGTSDQKITVEGRQIAGAPDWSRAGAPTIFGSQQEAD